MNYSLYKAIFPTTCSQPVDAITFHSDGYAMLSDAFVAADTGQATLLDNAILIERLGLRLTFGLVDSALHWNDIVCYWSNAVCPLPW